MIGLMQRVRRAEVRVDDRVVGRIGPGLAVLVGFERADREQRLERFLQRLLAYRVFADDQGRMNLGLKDVGGGLLLVPQFTLAADTDSGNRPSFTPAAPPERGRALFDQLCKMARQAWPDTATGCFGADMDVELVNQGPVTFWLQVR